MEYPVVNMDEHLSFDNVVNAAMVERYAMPAVVVAALRQAGKTVTMKLLALVESSKFDSLPIETQMRVIEFVFNRAYGKAETATASLNIIQRNGGLQQADATMANQLKEIEQRMASREQKFPEMQRAQKAIEAKAEVPMRGNNERAHYAGVTRSREDATESGGEGGQVVRLRRA